MNPTPHEESLKNPRNYEVGAQIGRGGMGEVLSAVDRNLYRTVAMKVIATDTPLTEARTLRFIEEARVTARLEHPSIVPVHELGLDEHGRLFYTMKLVKGVTLSHVLSHPVQKYSLTQLLAVFQKICDAIRFAHSEGLLHRDLKPENVMLGEFGEVIVLDWGLAKRIEDQAAETADPKPKGDNEADRSKAVLPPSLGVRTHEDTIFGTPHYMAPEQAAGNSDQVDARTDIYALGAILYNILTLLPPVEGETSGVALRNAAENRITPPEQRAPNRDIPLELSAIAMKCLAEDRADRYQSVAELRRDIDLFLEGRSVSARPDTVPQALWRLLVRQKTISIAAAIIVALSVGFTVRVIGEGRRAERALVALRSTAPIYHGQARVLMAQSKYDEALDRLSRAMEFDPDNADYHALKGNICQTLVRLREARDEYAKALELNPKHGAAAVNLKLCETILRRDKDAAEPSAESLHQLVRSLRSQNRYEDAIVLAQRPNGPKMSAQATWKTKLESAGITARSLAVFDDDTLALDLRRVKLTDLAALKGMPIVTLDIAHTGVASLEPLRGMPLEWLVLDSTKVTDLSPLRGMKLRRLVLSNVRCSDFRPLKGMPLTMLLCDNTGVSDLGPLQGMGLESFAFTPKNITKGIPIVRQMKSIRRITNHFEWPDRGWQNPDGFWRKYDAGSFK